MATEPNTTTYKAPEGVVTATIDGVEHAVQDGLLTLETLAPHLHNMLTRSMGFAVATEADIEGVFDSKSAKSEKAELVAAIKAAGLKIDARASLAYVRERYNAYVADGHLKPETGAALSASASAGAPNTEAPKTDVAEAAKTDAAASDAPKS